MSEHRSSCPVACTLDLLGDRWSLLVLRDMMFGAQYFDDFSRSPEGIASNILGDRLRKLESDGLLTRERDPADGRRVRYSLTERGRSLKPVLLALARWGLANVEGTEVPGFLRPILESGRKRS